MIISGSAIQVEGIRHAFVPSEPILEVDGLEVASGEILVLIGSSGSGKTTLLNVIGGLLKPTQGIVNRLAPNGERLGVVFQDAALLPWRTVTENVRLPLELTGGSDADGQRVARAISAACVAGFDTFLPRQLSGGLQSRVAIARALVTDPTLLLLDEPFGSLDEVTSETVMFDLAGALQASGATAVMVTHNLEHAAFLADRVVVLGSKPGRVHAILEIHPPRPRNPSAFRGREMTVAVDRLRAALREACR